MATALDDHLVDDALTALDGWTGNHEKITRTVEVTGDEAETLVTSVATAAEAMDHHPDVDRSDRGVTFTLSTHSEGGVTELDITLASRIDDLALRAQHEHRNLEGQIVDESEEHGETVIEQEPEPTVDSGVKVYANPGLGEGVGESLEGGRDPLSNSEGQDSPRDVDAELDPGRNEAREL